jgi:hypothetical protein
LIAGGGRAQYILRVDTNAKRKVAHA